MNGIVVLTALHLVTGFTSCTASTLKIDEPLVCMSTIKENVLRMHYKAESTDHTLFLCFENLADNSYVAAGPGRGMENGTRAVVAATGYDQNDALNITEVSFPRNLFVNFGHTKLKNLVQNGTRINCFQIPYSRLDPDASISEAYFSWAVGKRESFGYHRERGVFKFNFQSGETVNVYSDAPLIIVFHIICMMTAFLIIYPTSILVAAYAGKQFQKHPSYLKAHVALMVVAIILTIVGVILSLSFSEVDTLHGYVGLVVSSLCVLQPVNAYFRPGENHKRRRMWEHLHKGIGRVCAILGFLTCVFGVMEFSDRYGMLSLMLSLVLVPLIIVVVIWLGQTGGTTRVERVQQDEN